MARRREELEVGIVASDNASAAIDEVADKVQRLDGETADVAVTADDKASAEIRELMSRIEGLTDDEQKVILNAESKKLQAEVRKATILLGKVDGEEAEAVLDAKNTAQAKLDRVQGELNAIDGRIADATLDATDRASGDIDRVDGKLDGIDGRTADATVSVSGRGGESLSDMAGDVGLIGAGMRTLASPAGAAAALGAILVGTATSTGNMALDVNSLANFTGEDFAYTDKFVQVARNWGDLDLNDLFEIIAELQQKLRDTPDLAEKFGVDADFVIDSPLQGIVTLIDAIRDSSLSASEKAEAMFGLFGEEGAKQLIPLLTNVDSLSQLIEDSPSLFNEDDLVTARELNKQIQDFKQTFGAFSAAVGTPLLGWATDFFNELQRIGSSLPWNDPGDPNALEWADNIDEAVQRVLDSFDFDDGPIDMGVFDAALAEEGLERVGTEIRRVNKANKDAVRAWEEHTRALRDNVDAAHDAIDTYEELGDASLAAAESELNWKDAIERTNEVFADNESSATDRERAIISLIRETLALAEADSELAGEAENSAAAIDRRNDRLLETASLTSGAVREAILDHIFLINGIPDDVQTDILAAIDEGNWEEADRLITHHSRPRTISVDVELEEKRLAWSVNRAVFLAQQQVPPIAVDGEVQMTVGFAGGRSAKQTADRITEPFTRSRKFSLSVVPYQRGFDWVRGKINSLTQARNVTVAVRPYEWSFTNVARKLASLAQDRYVDFVARSRGKLGGRATGDPFTPQGRFLVGEQGPELVELPRGSRITPNHRMDTVEAAPTSTVNNYVTINAPAGTRPADIVNAQRKYERTQGPT